MIQGIFLAPLVDIYLGEQNPQSKQGWKGRTWREAFIYFHGCTPAQSLPRIYSDVLYRGAGHSWDWVTGKSKV